MLYQLKFFNCEKSMMKNYNKNFMPTDSSTVFILVSYFCLKALWRKENNMVPLGEQSSISHTFSNGAVADKQWEGCTVVFNLYN